MEIQLQLVSAVARQLQPYLDHALRAQCNGCLVDHPSQYQHECIMLEGEDGIRYGLELALTLIDWNAVKHDFWQHVSINHMINLPKCYNDVNWLQKLYQYDSCKELLVSALLN